MLAQRLALLTLFFSISASSVQAQTTPPTAPPAPAIRPDYPDSASGLEHLAKDIIAAQKKDNGARADALLRSLVMPNFREWYAENFTKPAAGRVIPAYTAAESRLPAQLAQVFLDTLQAGFSSVSAVRYQDEQSACSSARVFGAMTARRTQVPLYELRFAHGDRFKSVFAFTYVDGAFRIVLIPDFAKPGGQVPKAAPDAGASATKQEGPFKAGALVQAAKLVCNVPPHYPEEARREHVSGTVRFHAIIGKDGSIRSLAAQTGPDILVSAAKAAVSQWRYRPTMLNGEPVEVDTTIEVIFSLAP